MFKIEVPAFDYGKVAGFCVDHAEPVSSLVASKVFGDAVNTTCTEVTDTIGHYLRNVVSSASSRKLHFAYSFAWVYPKGAFVEPHIDRDQLEWYCGLTMEQDKPWCYQTIYGEKWFSMPTGLGKGIVMDGSRYIHRRPVYTGERAVSVVCSYVENPADVEKIRRDLQFDHYTEETYRDVAGRIGLNPSDFLGFEQSPGSCIDVVDMNIGDEELDGYCKAMNREVYHRHSIDKTLPVLHGQIFTPLMGLHMQLKDWMKNRFGTPYTTPQPTGIMYRTENSDYVYETHPNDDMLIVVPLDRDSAASWKVSSGNMEPVECPYGKGLVLNGFPNTIRHHFAGGSCFGNWAIMPFRKYAIPEADNLISI